MKSYLGLYLQELEEIVEGKKAISLKDLEIVKTKIQFFQHERFIHLLVTLFFAFFALIFMVLGMLSYFFLIPFAILIVFLLFYIVHYFYLENGVQYLYKLYDRLFEKRE